MKHRTIGLTAALFAALIGTAFLFTACWQGNPAGGSDMPGGGGAITPGGTNPGNTNPGNTSAPDIEGINWRMENYGHVTTLLLKSGKANTTMTVAGTTISDSGKYTITDSTIKFTGFGTQASVFSGEYEYKLEGDTLTLSRPGAICQFKKA
ncbi:hypothetical protein TREVI0001_2111 [Treponema vincentii ATCC 35580]|uniref:Lipocalin-like domain-containing protein n=1 Tax=Treponema vincentii ATCC 35580 TaxID=596324 RepID=C8PQK7_9SPIR|nr:hypothetical protein [Treponema vincentii]EEV20362.1 hypothetical protein TREVI0001_2111 [Treponema vincentii ATCC 35580]